MSETAVSETAVCPKCTQPVAAGQDFCERCAAPVGAFTTTYALGSLGSRRPTGWVRWVAHALLFPIGILVALVCRIKRVFRR